MKGMVFAAGLGTRLRPLTNNIPKALVPVGGVPMLERVIRKLAASGVDSVVVTASHFAPKVTAFIASRDFGVPVSVSLETGAEPLETGGGIKKAGELLGGGPFLVHNVDILSDVDLGWFISSADSSALATLLVEDSHADRMLVFDAGMRLVGWTNTVTGEVRGPIREIDPSKHRLFSFCGIHVLSEGIFALMEGWPDRFGIMDLYLSACADHLIRGVAAPPSTRLIDIGTPETLAEAERLYFVR